MTLIKIFFPLLTLALLSVSCKNDNDKNSSLIFEELNESLERSNESINQDISASLRSLQNLTKKPETAEKGAILLSKAKLVEVSSLRVVDLIDSLTKQINSKVAANSFMNERKEKNFIADIFIDRKGGQNLYKSFINYRKDILSIDERIKKEFEVSMPIADNKFKRLFPGDEEFTKIYFEGKAVSQTLVILSKFKNDVLLSEYQTVYYLRSSNCILDIIYDDFTTTLTNQNSKHFKRGDELIIKTGIGSFKTENTKEILINNTKVNLMYGVGTYKIKVGNKLGKYQIPIQIKFINPNGKEIIFSEEINYSVDE